jgi:hypothetical protein
VHSKRLASGLETTTVLAQAPLPKIGSGETPVVLFVFLYYSLSRTNKPGALRAIVSGIMHGVRHKTTTTRYQRENGAPCTM